MIVLFFKNRRSTSIIAKVDYDNRRYFVQCRSFFLCSRKIQRARANTRSHLAHSWEYYGRALFHRKGYFKVIRIGLYKASTASPARAFYHDKGSNWKYKDCPLPVKKSILVPKLDPFGPGPGPGPSGYPCPIGGSFWAKLGEWPLQKSGHQGTKTPLHHAKIWCRQSKTTGTNS